MALEIEHPYWIPGFPKGVMNVQQARATVDVLRGKVPIVAVSPVAMQAQKIMDEITAWAD